MMSSPCPFEAVVTYGNLTFLASRGLICNYVTVVRVSDGKIGSPSKQDCQRIANALTRGISDINLRECNGPICQGWCAVTADDVERAIQEARTLLEKEGA